MIDYELKCCIREQSLKSRLQEVLDKEYTKSLGIQNNNDSRFAIVINKKGRATSDPAYTILQINLDLLLNLPPESSKLN
jgi:hypothetical protein